MPYKLCVDNNADLPLEYTRANDITVLPITVTLDGVTYNDTNDFSGGSNLDYKHFYQRMREGSRPSTAQLSPATYIERISPLLAAGYDVLLLSFASGLSGTYESSVIAKAELDELYPDRKFVTIDTITASLGYGLIVYLVNEKVKAGATLEEAAAYCEEIKLKIHHIVTVEDLIYLRRSGRVSATSAFFGTMLQIKPIIHLDNEGHLIAIEKKQGRRRALTTLVEYMERDGGALSGHPIFLSHGDCEEDALLVKAQIKQKLGADVMMIEMISPNIGAHSGPGTVALFYVSDAPR